MPTYKEIRRAAEQQGWRVEATKAGEMFYPPDTLKPPVAAHGTPSDHRAIRNFLSRMRRSGLIWPPPRKGKKKEG